MAWLTAFDENFHLALQQPSINWLLSILQIQSNDLMADLCALYIHPRQKVYNLWECSPLQIPERCYLYESPHLSNFKGVYKPVQISCVKSAEAMLDDAMYVFSFPQASKIKNGSLIIVNTSVTVQIIPTLLGGEGDVPRKRATSLFSKTGSHIIDAHIMKKLELKKINSVAREQILWWGPKTMTSVFPALSWRKCLPFQCSTSSLTVWRQ